jgi:transposase
MDSLKLNTWERRRLRRQLRATRDARIYRRTLAILEVDRGRPVGDVATSFGVEPRTIYYWIEAYLQDHDPASLADGERTGRPSLWDDGLDRRLRAAMARSPQDLGYPSVDWTVPVLREHLAGRCGWSPSDDTIRRAIRRLGYVWKRPRYVLEPDPELEKKNGGSAARSAGSRPGPSSWPRTRPICCSSPRSEPPGPRGVSRRRSASRAGTPVG